MLIVDTGVIVAAADRSDTHHKPCADLLENAPGPLVTSPMVIAEAAYLLNRELGPAAEVATLDRRHFAVVRPVHTTAFTLLP